MPELPEMEITARRLSESLAGETIETAVVPGINALKTFDPPLSALEGAKIEGVRRRWKLLMLDAGGLTLLMHLMSAGRLQLFPKRATMKDRTMRVGLRLSEDRELRLREFGTKQAAWAKLLRRDEVEQDELVATLGPDAWPAPPLEEFREAIDESRHLHPLLRHQRDIAGIGRSWVDEILWEAKLSPFKKGSELRGEEVKALHDALHVLGDAIDHYEDVIGDQIPDKMPMPLQVHRREGEPCPRCGTTIEAVFFSEHQMNYCPEEQTGGRVLKDRRLSRLLK